MRNPFAGLREFRAATHLGLGFGLGVWLACVAAASAAEPPGQSTDYREAIQRLETAVAAELNRGTISGVSVALVDDQRVIYVKGFGFADKKRRVPARSDTVYRAGSISKLFTAIAAMQLAEQGKLDLDQPVRGYNPDFQVVVPFEDAKPVTLRQLMCHRSGLFRESPVGGYFDPNEAGVAATMASLSSCVLVHLPETKTKYSNVGPTVVGDTVAKVAGQRFEDYQNARLLGPLGMRNSGFLLNKALKAKLAKGYLPVADGRDGFREIEAPAFELGTIPAGNLYTTAEDLAAFLKFLFANGVAGGQALLKPESLAEMFTPQLTKESEGFGLGFAVRSFRGKKTVSHMGAVYGFTSAITGLPQHKLGVVVLCNDDIAVGPVRKLNNLALGALLEAKLGDQGSPPARKLELQADALAGFAGDFESASWWARIEPGDGVLVANISGQRMELMPVEPLKFEASGRLVYDAPVVFEKDSSGRVNGFTALDQKFRRVDSSAVREIPDDWKRFLGSYGPDFIPLIVTVKHGHLYAMTENEYDNRLTPLNRTVFKMPPGLYTDEQLVFQVGSDGKVHSAVLANMTLPRRKR